MRALVIYESMFGNTHQVADAIAAGLRRAYDVDVVAVERIAPDALAGVALVVAGGPTHAHSLSRPSTRQGAVEQAAKPGAGLTLEPDVELPGLREWFDGLGDVPASAAAFDTRVGIAPTLSGRASKGIDKRFRRHGFDVVAEPASFLVDTHNRLLDGELDRARAWGAALATAGAAVRR